jgi:hypothetical protein
VSRRASTSNGGKGPPLTEHLAEVEGRARIDLNFCLIHGYFLASNGLNLARLLETT